MGEHKQCQATCISGGPHSVPHTKTQKDPKGNRGIRSSRMFFCSCIPVASMKLTLENKPSQLLETMIEHGLQNTCFEDHMIRIRFEPPKPHPMVKSMNPRFKSTWPTIWHHCAPPGFLQLATPEVIMASNVHPKYRPWYCWVRFPIMNCDHPHYIGWLPATINQQWFLNTAHLGVPETMINWW